MSIISNTTVLSNFAAIEVYKEVERGLEEGYTFYSGIEDVLHPVHEGGFS